MTASVLRHIFAGVASSIVLVASGASALPSVPRVPTVKLDREARAPKPQNERARATRPARTPAERYQVSIGRNIATNAKILNVQATFERATIRARACYLRAVEKDETAQGLAAFKLTLAPDGSVDVIESRTFEGSNLPGSVVECTMKVLLHMKFEPPTDYQENAVVIASATFGNIDSSVAPGPHRSTKQPTQPRQPRQLRPTASRKIVRTRI